MKIRRLHLNYFADLTVTRQRNDVRLTIGALSVDLRADTALALADALVDATETKEKK